MDTKLIKPSLFPTSPIIHSPPYLIRQKMNNRAGMKEVKKSVCVNSSKNMEFIKPNLFHNGPIIHSYLYLIKQRMNNRADIEEIE
jgi:hypothetical protein